METYTITFGDQAENHAGMEMLGIPAENGFTVDELYKIAEKVRSAEVVDIPGPTPAVILILRNGVSTEFTIDPNELMAEQAALEKDTKAYMYGRVVNKKARHNLCYDDIAREPDYEEKKGRIIAWSDVPILSSLRSKLPAIFGPKAEKLVGELNHYYNISECGIGFHGDTERRIVIGIRLGASLPLVYEWYQNGERLGLRTELILGHGDIYVMSEKAVGFDWKRKVIPTLRHAAGAAKFIA